MFIFLKMFITAIEFSAIILFCLSLFRIYFRYSLHKVAFIAIITAIISVYTRDILNEPSFAMLAVLATKIALITVLFQVPIIFSFLMVILGAVATMTVESFVAYLGSFLNVFTSEMHRTSIIQFVVYDSLITTILLVLVFYMQKIKFGFHTTDNDALKPYNSFLSGILVIGVIAMQFFTVAYYKSAVHFFLPASLGVLFLIGFILTYKHNKQLWKNRRERLTNRK